MNLRQIQEAREQYGIDDWGNGYFGINDQGLVVCHPTAEEHISVELTEIVNSCLEKGLETPLIIRFPQVIDNQLTRMHEAFRQAINEYNYQGLHQGVFPFKVNQRREFIDHIVSSGKKWDYGLEIGSKTELLAALSYSLTPRALLVCNGFKDTDFIRLGYIAAEMGKNIILVVEGPDELEKIIQLGQEYHHLPQIALRIRLYSKGSGKWEASSGEASKFGLTTIETLHCLELIEKADLSQQLTMLHFHIGSQITEIKRIKNALKEASRVYAKIKKLNFPIQYLNIGGGVGVDYDGSKTSFQNSANYSLQEFANDVIYVVGEVCSNESIDHPHIITESGRIIAAYHSVIVTNIREVQSPAHENLEDIGIKYEAETSHKCLKELKYITDNISRKNFIEYYHDAIEYYEELFTLFNLGYISLKERAIGEELFHKICHRALYYSTYLKNQLEEFEHLQKIMVSKYLANFSIFQSIPDAWSIDQLFPVMPLSHHHLKPNHKATIVDITCDSDGCLDRFIDRRDVRTVLDLHTPPNNEPYYLGFFLVGAYQESLSNEHNLFGAINECEVLVTSHNEWNISKLTPGDPIAELLICRNYDLDEMQKSYQEQLAQAVSEHRINNVQSEKYLKLLMDYHNSLPYLSHDAAPFLKYADHSLEAEFGKKPSTSLDNIENEAH